MLPDRPVETDCRSADAPRYRLQRTNQLDVGDRVADRALHEAVQVDVRLHRLDTEPHRQPLVRGETEVLHLPLEVLLEIAVVRPGSKRVLIGQVVVAKPANEAA